MAITLSHLILTWNVNLPWNFYSGFFPIKKKPSMKKLNLQNRYVRSQLSTLQNTL